jgi:hypothetical protein
MRNRIGMLILASLLAVPVFATEGMSCDMSKDGCCKAANSCCESKDAACCKDEKADCCKASCDMPGDESCQHDKQSAACAKACGDSCKKPSQNN